MWSPTSVVSGGKIIVGINNAIPGNSAVTLGDASTTGVLNLQTFTNAIGSLSFGLGHGTVAMASNQTASAQLAASGTVDLGSGNTLNLTGMSNTAGLYKLISASTLSGTFGTVTGLNSNYVLRYGTVNANELDAQHLADQTFTLTTPTGTPRVLVNTGVALTGTLTNATPNGSTALAAALTSTGTLSVTSLNSSTGATVAAGTPSTITGSIQTGATAGTFGWQVTNTDGNALTTTQNISGSLNVVNERTFTSPTTLNLGNLLENATVTVNSIQTITTAGLHNVTTDSTLAVYSGIPSNGLTLTGGSDFINGTNATDTITRTITGTLDTSSFGTKSFTFNLNATDELANLSHQCRRCQLHRQRGYCHGRP